MSLELFVRKRTTLFNFLFFVALAVPKNAHAVADFGNAGVLPPGRHQATLRFGNVSEIQDKFSNNGILQSPTRMNQRFDNAFLMKMPEFQQLAKIIDEQLLPNQKPSKDMDLGSLEFEGGADVTYFAPQIARGITDNWTIGVAVPFVKYQSDISTKNGGVNTAIGIVKGITDNVGEADKNLGSKVDMIKQGPKALFAANAQVNGYKEISDRNEQFIGDVVVGSSYKLFVTKKFDFYLLNQLVLPTGPKDDPDDLIDLNIFGKTELQTTLFTNYDLSRWLKLGFGVTYTWGIEDDIVKRVPRNEEDALPPVSQKESLDKDPGDSIGAQLMATVKMNDYYEFGAAYELESKESDKYTGVRGGRYDLLEKNTDSDFQVVKFKFTYTTVDGFLQGNNKIPYSMTYAFSDHVAGTNVERELTHEVLFKLYF